MPSPESGGGGKRQSTQSKTSLITGHWDPVGPGDPATDFRVDTLLRRW